MRKAIYSWRFILLFTTVMFAIVSCNKEMSASNSSNTSGNSTTTPTSGTIAVAADSTGADSVYILQQCSRGYFRNSITITALPDSVLVYLTNNYPGYSFKKGFEIKDSAGTVGGYVVIISFDGKPVGLLFDASGNFQQVLEQRERGDIEGNGWHHGGRFEDRDGKHRDTIAISALPVPISSYFSANYPSDTLIRAYQNRDSSVLVISRNNGLFATLFSSSGDFVKRIPLTPHGFSIIPLLVQSIAQDSLPTSDLNYLTTTYPNYVFETALSISVNGLLQGYAVVIDANNTKYAVWFDTSGNVVATQTIW